LNGVGELVRALISVEEQLTRVAAELGRGRTALGEATAALAVLGYGPAEITAALKGLDLETLSLEEIVRQALKNMIH